MRDVYHEMPKTIRIGCYIFKVEIGQEWEHNANNEFGHVNLCTQIIRVHPGLAGQKLANTFMHEVLHGIHMVYDLGDRSDEEDFTARVANGLCSFWQDNPEAVKWWGELVKLKGGTNERKS